MLRIFKEWCLNYNVVDTVSGIALFGDHNLDVDSLEGEDIEVNKTIGDLFKEFKECL